MTTNYPAPGDFAWMKNKSDAHMLTDMWAAVNTANAWDFVRGDPGDGGFMFSGSNKISAIMSHSKVGHSGASMAITLRAMQAIARDGWDAFVSRNDGPSKMTEKNEIGISEPVADGRGGASCVSALDCFQACGIADPNNKCEHGIPYYACMPCSH
jgi:hypothetical protein